MVEDISVNPDNFSLEGEARELTVFFSDIKNFSGMSEELEPRQLTQMLNTYFTEMTDILHRHGATIDKYIGDAIMAFWGAPLPIDDHRKARLGCRAGNAGGARWLAPQLQANVAGRRWKRALGSIPD